MRTRLLIFVASSVVLIGAGAGCHSRIWPVIVSAPDSVAIGQPVTITVSTEMSTRGADSLWVNYIIDWGDDSVETTTDFYLSTDTAEFTHTWTSAGTFRVSIENDVAVRYSGGKTGSKWTVPVDLDIVVTGGHEPTIETFIGPGYTPTGAETRFVVVAHDPDGDSLKVTFEWGDDSTSTTALASSPCTISVTHVYHRVESVRVKVRATDAKGVQGPSDSLLLRIGPHGAVMDYWWNNDEERSGFVSSPVVRSDGAGDCVWTAGEDGRFYGFPLDGHGQRHISPVVVPEFFFTGHAAYCEATNHIIVGSDEGNLCALSVPDLYVVWSYPPRSESTPGLEWGAAAINGNKLYVGHGSDSMFYFTDQGATVTRVAARAVAGSIVDAPAIDAAGNVYIGTDSGYLYKFDGNLNLVWRSPLQDNGDIHGPVLDADGTIYCTSDASRIYAVNPNDGSPKWTVTTDAGGTRPAVGADGVYLGTSTGRFYKFDKAAGSVLWEKQLGSAEFLTTPILSANGYVYTQNDLDVLYCVQASNGELAWACDCPHSLPRGKRTRMMQLVDYLPNPTIASDGIILVVGSDAVFKVKGYPDGPLDPNAPWPKWQHDLHNTGYVGGGR